MPTFTLDSLNSMSPWRLECYHGICIVSYIAYMKIMRILCRFSFSWLFNKTPRMRTCQTISTQQPSWRSNVHCWSTSIIATSSHVISLYHYFKGSRGNTITHCIPPHLLHWATWIASRNIDEGTIFCCNNIVAHLNLSKFFEYYRVLSLEHFIVYIEIWMATSLI